MIITLQFSRTFKISKNELWQWLTDNEKLSQWYGDYFIDEHGQYFMRRTFEDGPPVVPFKILNCYPNRYIEFEVGYPEFTWQFDLTLVPVKHGTRLELTNTIPEAFAFLSKRGWLHYYDCLEAIILGKELPILPELNL